MLALPRVLPLTEDEGGWIFIPFTVSSASSHRVEYSGIVSGNCRGRKRLHKCRIIVVVEQIPTETTNREGGTIRSKSAVRLAVGKCSFSSLFKAFFGAMSW